MIQSMITKKVQQGTPHVNPTELSSAIVEQFKTHPEWGLECANVHVRGFFSQQDNVPSKIRAYEKPHPNFDAPGHDLAADYWADQLQPSYFFKYTFGSKKQIVTPIADTLEWNIPSPPDFHHFSMVFFLLM